MKQRGPELSSENQDLEPGLLPVCSKSNLRKVSSELFHQPTKWR
jgi:hypothetical protein